MDLLICPTFAHYENRDGSIDSICNACLTIVASSFWEFELERQEEIHLCALVPEQLNRQHAGRVGAYHGREYGAGDRSSTRHSAVHRREL